MTDFKDLVRAFGPGRDLFDAPEDAFHAVVNAIRDDLAPTSILMFLIIESLIRSLKNQRRPVIHSIHDSRWQRGWAAGERMMCRMMTQLIKPNPPAKTARTAKNPPKMVEPAPVLDQHSPEPAATPEPATVEPVLPVLNPPEVVNPMVGSASRPVIAATNQTSPAPTVKSPSNPKPAHPGSAGDGAAQFIDPTNPIRLAGEIFRQKLAFDQRNREVSKSGTHQT